MKKYSFPKFEKIKKKYEFENIFKNAEKYISPYFIIYYIKGKLPKAGFSVKKKLGSAVIRNRIKRLLKEVYRLNKQKILSKMEIIIIAKEEVINKSYTQIENEFNKWIQNVK